MAQHPGSDPASPSPGEPAPGPGTGGDATRILRAASAGDEQAVDELLPLLYDRLRALAGAYLSDERREHTLQPTALVHEAYLRMVDMTRVDLRDRDRFFGLAARAMRRILVDHARGRKRQKRGGGWRRVELDGVHEALALDGVDLTELDEALEQLAARSDRQARIVELRFFGGLGNDEVARALDVSLTTVEREWRVARAWLSGRLREREA